MKNAVHSWVYTSKDTWLLAWQMSHFSVKTISSNLHYYIKKQNLKGFKQTAKEKN
jgi:hypothetical protein